jgi:hypothetical protein
MHESKRIQIDVLIPNREMKAEITERARDAELVGTARNFEQP